MDDGLAYYPVENYALFVFTGYLPHVMFCGLTIGHVHKPLSMNDEGVGFIQGFPPPH